MKIQNLFRNSSIFTKISIMTSVIIILISVLSTTFLASTYSREIQSRDRLLVQEAANKLFTFFQNSYNDMYNQRTLIHSSEHLSDIIEETRNNPSEIYDLETLHKITDYLNALAYSDSAIEDVIMFTADGETALSYSSHSGRRIYSGYEFINLSYIKNFRESDASITTVYDETPPYLSVSSSHSSEAVITFILKIYTYLGVDSQNPLGYIMVNYSPESVFDAYGDISSTSDGEYYVFNNQDEAIYASRTARLGKKFSPAWRHDLEIIFKKEVGLSGITVVGCLSNQKLMQTTISVIRNTILITGIGVLVMIIVILVLHRYYAHRFHRLAVAMENMSKGNFPIHLPVTSNDETGYLSKSFNRMSQTLNEYVCKTYLAETQRRTAELYALQAQINPHFLANTIESIRMNALGNDDYESAEMLKQLGNLFQLMIQFDQDIIYIDNEMEYTDSYLDLMKFRFADKLTVNIDIPADVYLLGIPRFTLQPILENALSHGSPNTRNMEISIRFSIEQDILAVTIEDNGPGIRETELTKLNNHIQGKCTCPQFGVALRNIHSRITLLFGPQYGLVVKSKYGQGTIVTVTFPAKEKKELEKYVQTTHC